MQKKIFVLLGLIAVIGMTAAQAFAEPIIYTDELGRMHFLGKDPNAKTLQQIDDYGNPQTKDVTNASYGLRNIDQYDVERYNVNSTGTSVITPSSDPSTAKEKVKYSTKHTTKYKPKDPLNVDDGNLGKHFWQIW